MHLVHVYNNVTIKICSNLCNYIRHTTATFADDTAILATHEDPAIASMKLQATINKTDD
jgi:hypothetical protein